MLHSYAKQSSDAEINAIAAICSFVLKQHTTESLVRYIV